MNYVVLGREEIILNMLFGVSPLNIRLGSFISWNFLLPFPSRGS